MSLGKRVEDKRKELGWTQPQLAAKVEGLTQQALDRLEKRDSKTSEHAVALAEALGVSLRWLLSGQGRPSDRDWPFPRVQQSRWDQCDDVDRGYVQAAINKALEDCEAQRPEGSSEKLPAANVRITHIHTLASRRRGATPRPSGSPSQGVEDITQKWGLF